MRAPRVAVKEMETYTPAELETIFEPTPAGWPILAVQILLGTGMRLGELCALELEDVEDDDEAMFLKIRPWEGRQIPRASLRDQAPWWARLWRLGESQPS